MTRKHTIAVPKCKDCRFVAWCKVEDIARRSLACMWNHYNFKAVENYMLQWDTHDWAYDSYDGPLWDFVPKEEIEKDINVIYGRGEEIKKGIRGGHGK